MTEGNNPESGNAATSDAPLDLDSAVEHLVSHREAEAEKAKAAPEAEDTSVEFLDEPEQPGHPQEPERRTEEEDEEQPEAAPEQERTSPELDLDAVIKVKGHGEVKLQELIDGNFRLADYTRKTQEIANERNFVQQRLQDFQQYEQQLAAERQFTQMVIGLAMPAEPPYNREDPIGSVEAKAAYDQQLKNWNALVAQFQNQRQQAEQRSNHERQAFVQQNKAREEAEFLTRFPEFRDKGKAQPFIESVLRYGREAWGLAPEELDVTSAKWAHVLHDAARYRMSLEAKAQAQTKAQAKVANVPPVRTVQAPARSRTGQFQSPQVKALQERFEKSLDLDSAVDLLHAKTQKRR